MDAVNNGTDAPTDMHHIIMMFLLRMMPLFMNALFLLDQYWESLAAQQRHFHAGA